jgi:glycosyltransferase involved in cell wall biosynthesis
MNRVVQRVVVINDDSIESGGAASIALASISQLRARGVPVTLLAGDDGSNPDLARWGVDFASLQGRHILEGSRAAAAMRGLYSQTTRVLLQRWIDINDTPGTVYHLHNWHKVLSASALVALRQVASRLVISTHDFFLACPNGGYFHFPRNQVCDLTPMGPACLIASCDKRYYAHKLWRVARHAIRQAVFDLRDTSATVLAVHEGMVPLLERGGIDRQAIRVLRNPVSPWRQSRVPAERNRTVLFVGRLDLDKGIDILVSAARKIAAPLRIIGDGELAAAIRRNHPEAELLGRLSRREIGEAVASARLVVLPTRGRETFGLVALEGAMSGIPVISSQSALITDELVRLGIGIACRPDEEGLAQQIASLMNNDLAVAAMSRRGFENARALAPTREEWCNELVTIYEDKILDAGQARKSGRRLLAAGPMEDSAIR